ncbi:hypothetical protein D3C81_1745160 [compost metagenome]
MVHVHIDRVQLTAGTGDKIIAPGDDGAHFFQHVGKANVALNAVTPDTGDFHRAAFNRTGGEEIGGG